MTKVNAKEAGIDVKNLSDEDFIKNFAQKLSFGTKSDVQLVKQVQVNLNFNYQDHKL